jgi:hypothetical protein
MERGVPRREARAAEASCRSSRDPRRRLRLLLLDFLLGIAAEGISGAQSRMWGSGSQGFKTAAEQVSSPVSHYGVLDSPQSLLASSATLTEFCFYFLDCIVKIRRGIKQI